MRDVKYIRSGWLVDGDGGPIRERAVVKVMDGCIDSFCAAGPDEPVQRGAPGVEVVDLSHCTVLPGLIDCHVHLFMSGSGDPEVRERQLVAGFDEMRGVISRHLDQHLSHGVVAVRDGGDRDGHALRFKREGLGRTSSPVQFRVAGRAWIKPGRYGRLIGRTPPGGVSLAEAIAGERDPVDHVKVVNSGLNSLKEFGKQTPPQFDADEMKAAAAAAKHRGLGVMVHANGVAPVRVSVAAGCRSVEHGFFMGEENLARMADARVTWVPTAITMKAYSECLKPSGKEADVSRRNLDHQLEQIRMARKRGTPIALGTDAGSLGVHHGAAAARELKLLMEAGLPLTEAVQCATGACARLLGLENSGTLAAGKWATLIAVAGPPENLPDSLARIEAVFIKGVNRGDEN
ncbi:MAG: amidohydrolase family protein [Desulfobacterales bacterium]|nr:amidohydrolase family protein [Desulfobacterales bacterium]